MDENLTKPNTDFSQLKRLRIALAVCQGAKLLQVIQQEAEATITHDQAKRVTFLTAMFLRIHRELFHHWKEQATVSHHPGWITAPEKRKQIRKAIARLVYDGENRDTAIFDNNGFVISFDDIAERLANFYQTMHQIRPFGYGNRITLDFFITVIGKLPAFKSVYEQGIDFRRISVQDAAVLHQPDSPFGAVVAAFSHALDASRCQNLPNLPNGYGVWPENRTFISGIPFLSHTTPDGVKCLVAVNGGLVPLASIAEDLFNAGKHFADYPLNIAGNVIGYLPATENLRVPDKREIDGMRIGEHGEAPLFCLDINMLTGLRTPSHTELMELLKQCAGEKASIFALANNPALQEKMLAAADGDERAQRGVEIAYERLAKITTRLNTARDAMFAGKTPDATPKLFMCMGGAGAGKTAVEEITRAQCGDNFVIASLDEFRRQSDLYQILTAANHHSDDYIYVEPFANSLRDRVAEHARNTRINLLYDGTSIPYSPRYSTIVEQFHTAGFYTHIIAVDAFLVKPEGREKELQRATVINSVRERYQQTGRALPWVVTIYKHIRSPEAFLLALEHEALDKLSLFANDGEKNRHYLVAESFNFDDDEIRSLQTQQLAGTLMQHLLSISRSHPHATLKNLAQDDTKKLEEFIARNAYLQEENAAYQIYPSSAKNRVLLIYNTGRMVDFIEKRQLNPHASGEAGLLHKSEALAFQVDPSAEKHWLVRLQAW